MTSLNLSSNELDGGAIRSCAQHLGALASLESLDLSCNRIDGLLGLPFLPRLSRLLVSYNRLSSLDGVQVRRAPQGRTVSLGLCRETVGWGNREAPHLKNSM